MAYRAELYCYFCGHGCGEVLVPGAMRRPSPEQLQTAYASTAEDVSPQWDGTQPHCPRCGGQLFLERFEHEVVRRADRALRKAS
ncbi:MAG: hypothetical protein HYX56_02815 [Chloroflexi bacterium]|nr:hypothetical protein [Chloroflexota bacterium]